MVQEISPPIDERKDRISQVIFIAIGHFIHDVYSAFFAPLLPLFIEKLSLSLTQAGFLSTFMQLPAILNPFIGYIADRVSLRIFVVLAPGVTATFMSLLGIAPNFWIMAVFLLIVGVSVAAFHAPTPAMIAQNAGSKVGLGMSIYMAAGEFARATGPIVGVWAVSTFTLEGYYPLAIIGWITSIILYYTLKEARVQHTKPLRISEIMPTLRAVFIPLTFVLFFRLFLAVSITTYLPTYMRFKDVTLFMAGASLSILEFAGVGGAFASGYFSDKMGRKPILIISMSASAILLLLFLKFDGLAQFIMLIPLGFFALSTAPVFLALVQDNFPENRATSNGIFLSISFLIRAMVAPVIGRMGDAVGLAQTFQWSAYLALLAIPFILMLPKAHSQDE